MAPSKPDSKDSPSKGSPSKDSPSKDSPSKDSPSKDSPSKGAALRFDEMLPGARFRELHHRMVDLPIDQVWPAALGVTGSEVRTLAPLFAIRGLPAVLRGRRPPLPVGDRPLIEMFVDEGFIVLRRDVEPTDGRAVLIFGAVGKFWSPTANHPVGFESPESFLAFDEPGYAVTVARVEAIAEGMSTRLETETLVAGTDPASDAKFAPYWAIIRGPSGLIRRSWLAGIDRRAHQHDAENS